MCISSISIFLVYFGGGHSLSLVLMPSHLSQAGNDMRTARRRGARTWAHLSRYQIISLSFISLKTLRASLLISRAHYAYVLGRRRNERVIRHSFTYRGAALPIYLPTSPWLAAWRIGAAVVAYLYAHLPLLYCLCLLP